MIAIIHVGLFGAFWTGVGPIGNEILNSPTFISPQDAHADAVHAMELGALGITAVVNAWERPPAFQDTNKASDRSNVIDFSGYKKSPGC